MNDIKELENEILKKFLNKLNKVSEWRKNDCCYLPCYEFVFNKNPKLKLIINIGGSYLQCAFEHVIYKYHIPTEYNDKINDFYERYRESQYEFALYAINNALD